MTNLQSEPLMLDKGEELKKNMYTKSYKSAELTSKELIVLNKIWSNVKYRSFLIKNIDIDSDELNILKRQIAKDNETVRKIKDKHEKRKKANEEELLDKIRRKIKDNPSLLIKLKSFGD